MSPEKHFLQMWEISVRLLKFAGDLSDEEDVLEWLRKNRFRQPELNLFMYALIAITLAFVMYTAFLMYGFKPHVKTT